MKGLGFSLKLKFKVRVAVSESEGGEAVTARVILVASRAVVVPHKERWTLTLNEFEQEVYDKTNMHITGM